MEKEMLSLSSLAAAATLEERQQLNVSMSAAGTARRSFSAKNADFRY